MFQELVFHRNIRFGTVVNDRFEYEFLPVRCAQQVVQILAGEAFERPFQPVIPEQPFAYRVLDTICPYFVHKLLISLCFTLEYGSLKDFGATQG